MPHLYLARLAARLDQVPPQGEAVQLVFVGNHCKGSIFFDGADLATPALTAAIERLARSMPEFYFGRIDVRFASTALLRRGAGVSGDRDQRRRLRGDAYLGSKHQASGGLAHAVLPLRCGVPDRRGQPPPWFQTSGVRAMYRDWKNQRRLMAAYPLND